MFVDQLGKLGFAVWTDYKNPTTNTRVSKSSILGRLKPSTQMWINESKVGFGFLN